MQSGLQELLENVADPKEFGKRGEPLFFGQLLLLALVFFPPAFFKVCLYHGLPCMRVSVPIVDWKMELHFAPFCCADISAKM